MWNNGFATCVGDDQEFFNNYLLPTWPDGGLFVMAVVRARRKRGRQGTGIATRHAPRAENHW